MAYSTNYTNRTTIFDAGDIIQGDHIKSIYDELGETPGSTVALADSVAPYAPGYWFSPCNGATTTSVLSSNNMTMIPWIVSKTSVSIDRVAIYITSVGSSGSVVRLGLYGSSNGIPSGDPIADWGTVDGTVLNERELTISQTVSRGLYWLAAVSQGAPSTHPTCRIPTAVHLGGSFGDSAASVLNTGLRGVRMGSVSGALPTIGTLANTNAPALIAVRFV